MLDGGDCGGRGGGDIIKYMHEYYSSTNLSLSLGACARVTVVVLCVCVCVCLSVCLLPR